MEPIQSFFIVFISLSLKTLSSWFLISNNSLIVGNELLIVAIKDMPNFSNKIFQKERIYYVYFKFANPESTEGFYHRIRFSIGERLAEMDKPEIIFFASRH
jgi:hypothetical protein